MPWFPRSRVRSWMIALMLVLGFVAWDGGARISHVQGLSSLYGVMVDPPEVDPSSPTGYALGRRSLILPDVGDDGLQWIMQTQAMFAEGTWRIHHVDYDNAPYGRETHWSAPFHWWLALIAWVDHSVSGRPIGISVERAALLANPLLHGLLLLGLVPVAARRFGNMPASLLAFGIAMAYPFNLYFAADYPDHHGVLEACALLTVLFLLAGGSGCIRATSGSSARSVDGRGLSAWLPERRAARWWFVASAVIGGAGLWVSAATQVPALVGVGIGAVWAAWWCRGSGQAEGWRLDPTLWRLWGVVGCATSVIAYLAEYFPFHLGFRLEVNHPLYALAWLGGGELLCRVVRMLDGGDPGFNRRDVRAGLLAAAAVALLPVVILLTKDKTFLVADRFVWLLGTEYVSEGQSLFSYFRRIASNPEAWARGLPLLAIILPLAAMGRWTLPRACRAQLVFALVPALLFLLLTLKEIRWWGVEYGMVFAALAMMFVILEQGSASPGSIKIWGLGCALLFAPGAVSVVKATMAERENTRSDVRHLAERDLAHWLRLRMGRAPVVVASTPATTNHLIYYGGVKGLGTLYWENTEGFRHAAEIFAAASPDRARELMERYGVTHIVLVSWDDFAESFVRFYRGLSATQPVPTDAFILGLLHGQGVPPWLRLIPYRLPGHDALNGQTALLFEVTPVQRPEAMTVHMTDYLVQMGRLDLAGKMAPALEQGSEYFPALVMLAYLQGKTGQAERFSETMGRINARLPTPASLDLEDRIRLAVVLWVGGQADAARQQLQQCLDTLDEPALRRLTPGTLTDLLKLSATLGREISDPALRQLAANLQPPFLRKP